MWFRVGVTSLVVCFVCLFVSHLFAEETARARASRPAVEIAITIDDSLLSESYLESARAQLAWASAAAASVVGRAVPRVPLLHANVATMDNLDALLTEYERAGASFITLEQALRDPIYQGDYEGSGGSVLTMAALASGRALPPALVRPLPLLELVCR